MFGSGCLELIIVAAAFAGAAAFVVADVVCLHTGIPPLLSVGRASLAAAISFGSAALFLTMVSAALHYLSGRNSKKG